MKNANLYNSYKKLAERQGKVIFGGRLGKYRYFDILLSLYNNETGASTDSFDKSLKDNIDFLLKFGVYDSSHIKRLKYKMWKCIINKKIKRYFPFYSWYHKKHLKDMGWIECDLNTVLKNI